MRGHSPSLTWICTAVALCLFAVDGIGQPTRAQGSKIYPKASFTFDDSAIYDLRSDGRGTYAHAAKDGYGGAIDAEFTVDGSKANVNLNLVKSGRKFGGAYRYDSPGNACANPCTTIGDGGFGDGWFLTIYGVPAMYNGETRLAQALFTRGGASTLSKYAYPRFTSYWCGSNGGANACGTSLQGSGSLMVQVTRQDVGGVATWTVTAAPTLTYPAGDLSEIVEQTNSRTAVSRGLYRTSFRVVVQCISGCASLPYPPA